MMRFIAALWNQDKPDECALAARVAIQLRARRGLESKNRRARSAAVLLWPWE